MAFRLRHWIWIVVFGWAAVAVALLPPPGKSRSIGLAAPAHVDNTAREAQGQLTLRIRELRTRLEIQRISDTVVAQTDRTRMATDGPDVFADETVDPLLRQRLQRQLRAQWSELGKPSAVTVALYVRVKDFYVLDMLAPRAPSGISAVTLLPDATDGTTCIRILTINRNHSLVQAQSNRALPTDVHQYGTGMGPCGFYAAFGEPSAPIAKWLRQTQYHFGHAARWNEGVIVKHDTDDMLRRTRAAASYNLSTQALACAAGKLAECTNILTNSTRLDRSPDPRISPNWLEQRVTRSRYLPLFGWHLNGAETNLLSNLVAQFGQDRFGEMWRSEDPFHDAFAELVGRQPARWMKDWVQMELGVVRASPSVSLAFVLTLVLAITVSVSFAMWEATRRNLS